MTKYLIINLITSLTIVVLTALFVYRFNKLAKSYRVIEAAIENMKIVSACCTCPAALHPHFHYAESEAIHSKLAEANRRIRFGDLIIMLPHEEIIK